MRSYKILFIVIISLIHLLLTKESYSQGNEKIQKSINIDKITSATPLSANSIKNALDDIFSPSKLTSIMYDDEHRELDFETFCDSETFGLLKNKILLH